MTAITLPTSTLLEATSYLVSTASERNTLPVLSMFMIMVKGDSVRLVASSRERELMYTCKANQAEDGVMVVPGKKLHDLVRNAPKESEATLKQVDDNEYKLTFSGLRSRYTLRGVAAEGFPTYALDKESMHILAVPAATLDEGLSAVSISAGDNDARSYLNGVAFRYIDGSAYLTTTDGHRLSQYALALDKGEPAPDKDFTRIVPKKTIRHLKDLLKGASGTVKYVLTDRHFAIRVGARSLKTNLIDGRFPYVNRLIPDPSNAPCTLDRQLWLEVTRRIAILTNEKFRGAQITVTKGESVMTLTSHNPENEEAQEQIPLISAAKEDIYMGINIDYLRSALEQINTQQVLMHFSDNASAIRVNGDGDDQHLHVIMPMRI